MDRKVSGDFHPSDPVATLALGTVRDGLSYASTKYGAPAIFDSTRHRCSHNAACAQCRNLLAGYTHFEEHSSGVLSQRRCTTRDRTWSD